MIVGAHDGTYRFPWWVGRVAAGGEVLYPAQGRIQLIDARDLGRLLQQVRINGAPVHRRGADDVAAVRRIGVGVFHGFRKKHTRGGDRSSARAGWRQAR